MPNCVHLYCIGLGCKPFYILLTNMCVVWYKQSGWFILRIVFILVGVLRPIFSGLIFSITCLSRARLGCCGTIESWLSHGCGTVDVGLLRVGLSHRCGTVDVGLSMWDC